VITPAARGGREGELPRFWFLLIFVFALAVRLIGLDWDQHHHFHPDERAIADHVGRLSLAWRNLELNPHWFNYGTFPLYIFRAVADALGVFFPDLLKYDNLLLVCRAVIGVAGALTVLVLMRLGTRLYNARVGLLAGMFLAASPAHIQNSHYATTDIFLTLMVLIALCGAVGIVHRGWWRDYILAGAGIGLAMATKFSAAPLFAPLGVALLVRAYRDGGLGRAVLGGIVAVVAAGALFFCGQPYAILDFRAYYKDILEQSVMVRTAGTFPYTWQYYGTPKYGYEITQLVLFGMAPALGIVAVWATLRQAFGALRTSGETLVLLGYVVPFFLVTGWFEVKFVRYMLPLYPIMCLWAAAWLARRSPQTTLMRILTWIVVGGTFLAAAALMSIYTRPHTVVTASEWVHRYIPPGSKIVTQHWDEGFPFSLPGYSAGRYDPYEMPYYEEDRPAKIKDISEHLAGAEYLVLQTKRLYGAVTRAPQRFPLTSKYFYLLFAGDLGYTLIYDHASRPGLLGFEVPTELLDESISVYDHPKVLIFQNTGHLTSEDINDKILRGFPSKQLTRNDLLLARAGDHELGATAAETTAVRSSWLATLWFGAVVEILGLSTYAILYRWLPVSGVYALSKVLGVLLFGYIPWLLAGMQQVEFTRTTLAVTLLAMVILGLLARSRWPQRPTRREALPTEVLFWGSFALFLIIRAFNPEIFWGEKPMDFAFLNALTRTTELPPPEPWFAGSSLHYSYFGHYLVAALGKICTIHPGVTFNLAIALIGGLTTVAAFAFGCALSDRWRVGALAAVFATLMGNLDGPREIIARKVMNFDYFWATSRVIKDTINEYPYWSFLFADLHAHVLVMPFSVVFATLVLWWARRDELRVPVRGPALLFLLALSLGAIMVTNTWSSFTYIPFFPFILIGVFLTRTHGGLLRWVWHLGTQVIAPTLIVVPLAIALYFPYWQSWSAPESNWGWENDTFVELWDYVNIWGLFLFILIPYLFVTWRRQLLGPHRDRLGLLRALPMWVVAIGIAVSMYVSVRTGLVMLAALGFHLGLSRHVTPRHRLVLLLTGFGFAVTAGCDFIHIWDRMNTIFKFYLETWFIFSGVAAAAAYELWRGAFRSHWIRSAWRTGYVLLIAVALFTAGSATYGVINTKRVRTPRPTLDGIAYLPMHDAHDAAAYEWLNQNIAGIPVITEAYGPSYQEFARVSMNTGLPTVLGWDYHVHQRAQPWNDINKRKSDLEKLYTTDSEDAAAALLQKYHVSLVYVGGVERKRYAGGNLERFREWKDLLSPVYQNAGVTVFGVKGRFTTQRVATIEEIPPEEGTEAAPAAGEAGELRQPRGVAIASDGTIYIADWDNHRIQAFNRELDFVRKWGERGDLPSQFKQPGDVAIDAGNNVYVADTWNQRVQVFTAEGKYLREFGGAWYGPRGIAVAADGKVYVSDTGNHRVRRFSATGQEEVTWGGIGSAPGQFKEPIGIAVDSHGQVLVCDNGNGRVQIFDANGQLLDSFPVDGWDTKAFSEPHIALESDDIIWVSIPLKKVIRAYDRDGKLLHEILGEQNGKTYFKVPLGVAYDRETKDLVVTDLENNIARMPIPE
jgi:YYY domain-containing protein